MKKLLCLTTALCLGALSAQAQGWGYVPQNVQRPAYRVPVQAQKQQQYRPTNTAPVIQRQDQPVYTAPVQTQAPVTNAITQMNTSYVPAHQKYAISNPMYMLDAGYFMGNVAYQYLIYPKDKDYRTKRNDAWGWNLDFAVGLTDRLSLSADLGYTYAWEKKAIDHTKEWGGTIGVQYNLINTPILDMHAGVNMTYLKAMGRTDWDKGDTSTTYVEPFIQVGTTVNAMFTPYLRVGYQSMLFAKDEAWKEGYVATPGLYFQPIPQLGVDLNVTTAEGVNSSWELRLDVYPAENISIGLSGYLTSPRDAIQDIYGIGTNFRFVF